MRLLHLFIFKYDAKRRLFGLLEEANVVNYEDMDILKTAAWSVGIVISSNLSGIGGPHELSNPNWRPGLCCGRGGVA